MLSNETLMKKVQKVCLEKFELDIENKLATNFGILDQSTPIQGF